MTVNGIIHEVRNIILKYAKPERIYLFGSRVNGEATETSDIDIAYDDANLMDDSIIQKEVKALDTLIKVDVTNIAFAESRFKNRVVSTGKVLYSATKKLRAEDALYNFTQALERFSRVVDSEESFKHDGYHDVYLDLVVKRFEFTYEMSWKALKRYLGYSGVATDSPRMAFREGFSQGMIADESVWLDMIEQRNISSHVYDEYQVKGIIEKKEKYRNAFVGLKEKIEKALKGDEGE